MADVRTGYAAAVTMTISLASVGDAAGRESLYVDNGGANKYLDGLVMGQIKPQNSGSITAPSAVFVYAYASVDGGTTYPDTITGADAVWTPNSPSQLKLLGTIYVAAINITYKGGPWSVASLYGGKMPERWGIAVYNDCGTALSATGGDHVFKYQGIFATVV